jgi:hypothetical protein
MSKELMQNNRLLLELEQAIRTINREVLNPVIPEMTIKGLHPVLKMAASARANYLKMLLKLGDESNDAQLSPSQIETLQKLRVTYDECVAGAQALETAIQREYLDVKQV